MTRVKICGITTLQDALVAVRAGAHALGFVFADSPRQITPGKVRRIVCELPPFVTTVGVFVNRPAEQVEDILQESRVQMAQLHGDEPPARCTALRFPAIKRIPIDECSSQSVIRSECERYGAIGYLLDPGGGSGQQFDWTRLVEPGVEAPDALVPPGRYLIVAGGLDSENVAGVISLLRPFGVDVCTGVEAAPGRKDARRLRAFIQAVEDADAVHAP